MRLRHGRVQRRGGAAPWIAEVDGARAGCVFCVRENATTARLRLLVEPWAGPATESRRDAAGRYDIASSA